MKFCKNCGKELVDEAVVCPGCGASQNTYNAPAQTDSVSVGLVILSILIPLFGIIYWPVKAKETPKRAKACGIAAIISWVVNILLVIIFYVVIYVIAMSSYYYY